MSSDNQMRRFVVVVSVSIASLIALAVIGSAIILPHTEYGTPEEIKNWGGLIIGFYFGSFIGVLKDWYGPVRTSQDTSHS